METESIQKLEAGAELDALIAERVMGYVRVRNDDGRKDGMTTFMVYRGEKVLRGTPYTAKGYRGCMFSFADWSPSTDISAAWEVVEQMRAEGWIVRVQEMPDGLPFLAGSGWEAYEGQQIDRRSLCWFYPSTPLREKVNDFLRDVTAFGETTPLAICRAALKAFATTQDSRA